MPKTISIPMTGKIPTGGGVAAVGMAISKIKSKKKKKLTPEEMEKEVDDFIKSDEGKLVKAAMKELQEKGLLHGKGKKPPKGRHQLNVSTQVELGKKVHKTSSDIASEIKKLKLKKAKNEKSKSTNNGSKGRY